MDIIPFGSSVYNENTMRAFNSLCLYIYSMLKNHVHLWNYVNMYSSMECESVSTYFHLLAPGHP